MSFSGGRGLVAGWFCVCFLSGGRVGGGERLLDAPGEGVMSAGGGGRTCKACVEVECEYFIRGRSDGMTR
jgi:hypothetical protein